MQKKTGGTAPDQRMLKDKVVSYIGVGGSDWSTRIQCDFFNQALTPAWKVIDTEVFSWSKCIIMEDEKVQRDLIRSALILPRLPQIWKMQNGRGDPGVCPHCHCREFYLSDDSCTGNLFAPAVW